MYSPYALPREHRLWWFCKDQVEDRFYCKSVKAITAVRDNLLHHCIKTNRSFCHLTLEDKYIFVTSINDTHVHYIYHYNIWYNCVVVFAFVFH